MASLNDRDAGRDFEGNGPSSFDPRDYRVSPLDAPEPSQATMDACAAAVAQIELAFGKFDRVTGRYVSPSVARAA